MLVRLVAVMALSVAVAGVPVAGHAQDVGDGRGSVVRSPDRPSYVVALREQDSKGRSWRGRETVSFRNSTARSMRTVWLRLWGNGRSGCRTPHPVRVGEVRGGTLGRPSVGCTAVPITLDVAVRPGARGSISFAVAIDAPVRKDRFGNDGARTYLGNALPVLAVQENGRWQLPPFSDKGESFYTLSGGFTVVLDHRSAHAVPATGTVVADLTRRDRTTKVIVASEVGDFSFAVGDFRATERTTGDGVVVRAWATRRVGQAAVRQALDQAVPAMRQFGRLYGPYPWKEVDMVLDDFTDYPFYGMEYPGLILALAPDGPITHELAHQWWYGIVGNDQYREPWLDEAFATYSAHRLEGILDEQCEGLPGFPSPSARVTNGMDYFDSTDHEYGHVVYSHGSCALADLADLIGEADMTTLLRAHARANWHRTATTAEFKALAQHMAGRDLGPLWSKWRIDG